MCIGGSAFSAGFLIDGGMYEEEPILEKWQNCQKSKIHKTGRMLHTLNSVRIIERHICKNTGVSCWEMAANLCLCHV